MRKTTQRKKKKNKIALLKQIELMHRLRRWAENANIDHKKGNEMKRCKQGTDLIRQSNPKSWLGHDLSQAIDLQILEEKATAHLDELIDQRDELNEHKQQLRRKLEAM